MDERISALLAGLVLARIPVSLPPRARTGSGPTRPLPAAYHILKPLFTDELRLQRIGALPATDSTVDPRLPLPLSLTRKIATTGGHEGSDIIKLALRRLQVADVAIPDESGVRARSVALSNVRCLGIPGSRLLLALIVPIRDSDLRRVVARLSMTPWKASDEVRPDFRAAPDSDPPLPMETN